MSKQQTREIAWIAGVGASAGLGAAIARRFAKEALTVVVSARTKARIEAIAAEIRDAGGLALAIPADVSKGGEVSDALSEIVRHGTLRAAVFNPSEGERAPSLELTEDAFEHAWRVTTLGGFIFGREVLRVFAPEGRGSLLFTGATASLRGRPPFAAFAAAKAGLRSLSQTFAREFGPRGIHVAHVVIDGGIDGERLRSRAPQRVRDAGPDGLLDIAAIADVYWHLHAQPRSAFTQELDLRPFNENF